MPDAVTYPAMALPQGPRIAILAGFLAVAGLPLYIHLPRLAAETGLSLVTVGVLLLGLRTLDFVQDPALGWFAERFRSYRSGLAALCFLTIGGVFAVIFAATPGIAIMTVALALGFTAYSLGTILFYAQCADLAGSAAADAHLKIAAWREPGALAGVVIAAALPGAVTAVAGSAAGFVALGIGVLFAAPVAIIAGQGLWQSTVRKTVLPDWRGLARGTPRRLLWIALLNALPVAVTSTLFLFFVEDRLELPEFAPVYLVLFFVAAGLAAPVWSAFARRLGARPVLLVAMSGAIAAFALTAILPTGAAAAFALISAASGAFLGAELVILPALFSAALVRDGLPASLGFGAWTFASKLSLALAAGLVLPALSIAGYEPGGTNSPAALAALTVGYAVIPLVLKVPAIFLVVRLREEVST